MSLNSFTTLGRQRMKGTSTLQYSLVEEMKRYMDVESNVKDRHEFPTFPFLEMQHI